MSAPPRDHDAILRAIQEWPRPEQVALAHEILRSAAREQSASEAASSTLRQGSWRRLIGILATDQPAPSDNEIERWREEHRLEKYGQ